MRSFLSQAKRCKWQEDISVLVTVIIIDVIIISKNWDTVLWMKEHSMLFHPQNCVSVFWNFIILPRYLGKNSLSLKSTWFPKEPWWRPFIYRAKQIKRNLGHGFVDQRQLKMLMDTVIKLILHQMLIFKKKNMKIDFS